MAEHFSSIGERIAHGLLYDPQIVSLKKLPTHAPNMPLPEQRYAVSLSGDWAFCFCQPLSQIPDGFYSPDYDCSGWRSMPVPSNWQTEGICPPKYINTRYEFQPETAKLTPPLIPDEANAAGLYRRKFTVPDEFRARQILVSFGGFESGLFVWVNGEFAGYASDGRSPAEFNITPYIVEGENLIAVCVTRFTAGSYLECQDMWRMSGIIRDVRIVSVPDCQLYDFFAWNDWSDDRRDAVLQLECKIMNHTRNCMPPMRVCAEVFDAEGKLAASAEGTTGNLSARWQEKRFSTEPEPVLGLTLATAHVSVPMKLVRKWSDEAPVRYRVELSLRTMDGDEVERCRFFHGFREVELTAEGFKLNGRSIKLRGVNRHEFSARGGHVVTEAEMRRDILTMKRNNINAVRCSHYPDADIWYELCDEYGLLVMDEANVESHGISYRKNLLPGNDPRWMTAMLDRVASMVQRNKNHPSVVIWSLGNELGFGENVALAAAYCHALDPARPVHKRQMNSVADMDSETYPSPQNMIDAAILHPDRPFVTNEYAHAMGNAMGSLGDYWDAIYAHDQLIGGFVWEWADHGLIPNGGRDGEFRYGGDFGEAFHDGNFCMDGVLTADRRPTAKLAELKKVHERVSVCADPEQPRNLTVRNGYAFTDLSEFVLHWELLRNGKCVQSGDIALPSTAPGESAIVCVPYDLPADGLCVLDCSIRLVHDAAWASAGHEVAFSQTRLREYVPDAASPACALLEEVDAFVLKTATASYRISRSTGLLSGVSACGRELVADEMLSANFWRAPTDNDRRSAYFLKQPGWKSCGLNRLKPTLRACDANTQGAAGENAACVMSEIRYSADGECGFDVSIVYTGKADGSLLCDVRVAPFGELPVLPRVGVALHLPAEFDLMTWYGAGEETYPDRKRCAREGLHTASVKDQQGYLRPQEYGSHQDCRFAALSDGKLSVAIKPYGGAAMGASPWLPCQLEQAVHSWELPDTEFVHLYMDAVQNGLGNRSCGPEVLEQYEARPVCRGFVFALYAFEGAVPDALFGETGEGATAAAWAEECNSGRGQARASSSDYKDPSDPDARRQAGFKE